MGVNSINQHSFSFFLCDYTTTSYYHFFCHIPIFLSRYKIYIKPIKCHYLYLSSSSSTVKNFFNYFFSSLSMCERTRFILRKASNLSCRANEQQVNSYFNWNSYDMTLKIITSLLIIELIEMASSLEF